MQVCFPALRLKIIKPCATSIKTNMKSTDEVGERKRVSVVQKDIKTC
jgi:hypothetical protein